MIDYPDAEGVTPDPLDPRRKKVPGSDPMLDELMDPSQASPSAPALPSDSRLSGNEFPAQPVGSNDTAGLPTSPYTNPPAYQNPPVAAATPTAAPTAAPAAGGAYTPTYTVEGLDMGKLGSGAGVTPKYQFWRAVQQGVPYEQAVKQIGGQVIDGNRFMLNGTVIDTRRDEEGANAAQWLELGGGSGGAGGGAGSAGGTGSGQGGQNDAIHQMLMDELQGLRGPVDPNDPRLKGQVDAFRNEQSRASQSARSALTERANYQGLPTGYVDAGIQSGIEDAGLQTAKFQGELTQREYENKRTELDRLLQMALSSSDSAAARSLQAEISALDRAQQNNQFYDTMGYNVNRDQNNLDYLMTQMLLQGGS